MDVESVVRLRKRYTAQSSIVREVTQCFDLSNGKLAWRVCVIRSFEVGSCHRKDTLGPVQMRSCKCFFRGGLKTCSDQSTAARGREGR